MSRSLTSASNIARRELCPGSAYAESQFPDQEDSEDSAEGTLLHDLDANMDKDRSGLKGEQIDVLRFAAETDAAIFRALTTSVGIARVQAFVWLSRSAAGTVRPHAFSTASIAPDNSSTDGAEHSISQPVRFNISSGSQALSMMSSSVILRLSICSVNIGAAPSYPARRVLDSLEEILVCCGRKPEHLRSDNGPVFVSHRVQQWAQSGQIGLNFTPRDWERLQALVARAVQGIRSKFLDARQTILLTNPAQFEIFNEAWLSNLHR